MDEVSRHDVRLSQSKRLHGAPTVLKAPKRLAVFQILYVSSYNDLSVLTAQDHR